MVPRMCRLSWHDMPLNTVKMKRFTLAFDDVELEREFLAEYTDAMRRQMQRFAFVAVLFCALAALGDADTRVGFVSRAVRYALASPAILLILIVTRLPTSPFRRVGQTANVVAWTVALAVIPAITLGIIRWAPLTSEDDPVALCSYGVGGETLILLMAATVSAMRFCHATPAVAATVLAYLYTCVLFVERFGHPAVVPVAVTLELGALMFGAATSHQREILSRRIFLQQRQLAEEREKLEAERTKSESLLRNILPAEIADRLKLDPSHIAEGFSEVTILFADIVGFTDLSARLTPAEVVAMLNRLFTAFDDLAEKYGLEKIKTIGDAYMVVGGLPEARSDHAEAVVAMALGMREVVSAVSKETGYGLQVRIGANSGPVVAGVIGKKKFAYDLWGDAVNTASRMESHGLAGEIQITAATCERVKDTFEMESRGTIHVKGKGDLPTWFVRGRKASPLAADEHARARRE